MSYPLRPTSATILLSIPRYLLAAFAAILCQSPLPIHAQQPPQPPHIVIIQADDMGWADLACYGNPLHETPHIDNIARQGMLLRQAYAAAPVCTPSRVALISGQSPARLNITGQSGYRRDDQSERLLLHPPFSTEFDNNVVSVAQRLKSVGYQTAIFGKWGEDGSPADWGFDHGGHPGKDDWQKSREAVAYIEKQMATSPKPTLIYFNFFWPHIPLEAEPADIAKYKAKADPTLPFNPAYAAITEYIDTAVGQIDAALQRRGLSDNTLLLFTSDNGGYTGRNPWDRIAYNEPLRDGKASLYEGGLRVPFIARWPGKIEPNTVSDSWIVVHNDLYPTLAEIAGAEIEPSYPLDGYSLLPIFQDPARQLDREAFLWHWPHYRRSFPGRDASPSSAIRMGDWKLLHFFEDGHRELYNLANDLGETTNLIDHQPIVAGRLALALQNAWRDTQAQFPIPNPAIQP